MKKQLNIKYAAGQFFYFSMFASMFAFVSVYLLHKGFDNATIGMVLSITSLSAIGIQTVLANYIDKRKDIRLQDRKSTRLNSSHVAISYAVFCLKKKKLHIQLMWYK